MQDGFIKVAACTPDVRVANVAYNLKACIREVRKVQADNGAKIIVLPELALTGYTCEDLFWQDALLDTAEAAVGAFASELADLDAFVFVGAPIRVNAKLYNCAVACCLGKIIGIVPKRNIPNYNEFYEDRHFSAGRLDPVLINLPLARASEVPFGVRQLFCCTAMPNLVVAAEICEDLWVPNPPSIAHAQAGATLVCNLSASNAIVGKASYRRELVVGQSARLICGYIYTSAGWGESTQDLVFSAHDMVAENGTLLAEGAPFRQRQAVSEVDIGMICAERRRLSTYHTFSSASEAGYTLSNFSLKIEPTTLTRRIDPHPFVPSDKAGRDARCEDVLSIQSYGLAKRLIHTKSKHVVIGVSGGLDSTLALLVSARAFDAVGLDRKGIIAITMPGFGTTKRTHSNAAELADALGVSLREVSISAAVRQHFRDIGHDESIHDVTYENSQARERTKILMDIANQEGGLVVGTGDLSELALGWATYNGDHMSMYGVNAGVPKTLVRHLIDYVASSCASKKLAATLADVLATPVSPELLPADETGSITQRTEDLVGPYELHDFFLYQVLRRGFAPRKVYRLACYALGETYGKADIKKWLRVFYRRFFAQQFKRSCLPDAPKVGSVAVSPRGDLRMPSDACSDLWLAQVDDL